MRHGARRSVSKSCNILAELGQLDIVVSIGDCGGSLFGGKALFSKGCARLSVGTMVLVWEDAVGCHSKTCEVDDAVGVVVVVVVVVFKAEAWDLDARCLPVL